MIKKLLCTVFVIIFCCFLSSEWIMAAEVESSQNSLKEAAASTMITSGTCGEDLTWKLDSEGVFTVSGTGAMAVYEFDWVDYYEPLVPWSGYRNHIKKVVIEDGVQSISQYAFYECPNMTEVIIGNDVESIAKMAFSHTNNVKKITMGKGIKQIADRAFNGWTHLEEIHISDLEAWCGIEYEEVSSHPANGSELYNVTTKLYINGVEAADVVIPNGVEKICDYAFLNCHIENIQIPESVICIGKYAFEGCDFTSVEIPKNLTEMKLAFSGCEELISVEIPDGFTSIGFGMFLNCKKLESVLIPDSVTTIEGGVFAGCTGLQQIVIPDSVTSIGDSCFYGCTKLTNVLLSKALTEIGQDVFLMCDSLNSIEIPDSVEIMGSGVFRECGNLESILLPSKLKKISSKMFENCSKLVELTIPEGVTEIGSDAFSGCQLLQQIIIPNSVETIQNNAFSDCISLKTAISFENIKEIGKNAFSGCTSLKEAKLYLTTVEEGLFDGCSALDKVVLADGVTVIEANSFRGCAISEIAIPTTVISIGENAFADCSSLKIVNFEGNCPVISDNTFLNVTAVCNYPAGDETYTAEIKASDFGGDLLWTYEGEGTSEDANRCGDNVVWELQNDGTLLISGEGAMYDYAISDLNYAPWYEKRSSVTAIKIEGGVTHIGEYAFYSCSAAESIAMNDAIDSIGQYAFSKTKITSLTLPEGITAVGKGAFSDNYQLREAVLPNSLTYISDDMFKNCCELRTVEFPDMITSIGEYAFSGCYCLYSVVLPEGLVSLGNKAFALCGAYDMYSGYYQCSNFTSVTLPSTLKYIGTGAFNRCQVLRSIELPANIESIGDSAFAYCTRLSTVIFRWGVPEIHSQGFLLTTASCYYPQNNPDWTSDVLKRYGGTLTWIPMEMEAPGGSGDGSGDSGEENPDGGDSDGSEDGADGSEGGEGTGGDSGSEGENPGGGNTGDGTGGTGSGNEGDGDTGSVVHRLELVEAKSPSCKESGNIAYYRCTMEGCSNLFLDAEGKEPTTEAEVLLEAVHGTELKMVEAVAPGCTTSGTEAYYYCVLCVDEDNNPTALFRDEEGRIPIPAPQEIQPAGHKISGYTAVDGDTHKVTCTVCNKEEIEEMHLWTNGACQKCGYQQEVTYTVEIYEAGVLKETKENVKGGAFVTVTAAAAKEDKVFSYWSYEAENGTVISTSRSYTFYVSQNMSIYAVYEAEEEKAEVVPIIAVSNTYASASGTKNYICFEVMRDIPTGYQLVEHGILYGTSTSTFGDGTNSELIEEKLQFVDDMGTVLKTNVKKYKASTTASKGAFTLRANVGQKTEMYVHARGYMILKDADGNTVIVYSSVSSAAFQQLKVK